MFAYSPDQLLASKSILDWSGNIAPTHKSFDAWIQERGLRFDPFAYLNAVEDPRLEQYFVEHDLFARMWGSAPALIFAPPGGGKSALRCQITRSCWIGNETNRPFPIPYLPPYLAWGHVSPSLEDHTAALALSGAKALLVVLAYRPHWFLRLSLEKRDAVAHLLADILPWPLAEYVQVVRETLSPMPLKDLLGLEPAFALPDEPRAELLRAWCDAWPRVEESQSPHPTEQWQRLLQVLLNVFRFEGAYVLLDGLDAAPETGGLNESSAEAIAQILKPLLDISALWNGQGIYLKGFLPLEAYTTVLDACPDLASKMTVCTMHWTPTALIRLIQRRLYVASEGAFDSLAAMAAPGLQDIEQQLAEHLEKEALLLPREMLVLTRAVIETHVARASTVPYVEQEDVEATLTWYRTARPSIKVPLI